MKSIPDIYCPGCGHFPLKLVKKYVSKERYYCQGCKTSWKINKMKGK
jgi:transposase-like protein